MHSDISGESAVKPDVVIVANFAWTDGTGNCRFNDLARRLVAHGAKVELITSNFNHNSHDWRPPPSITTDYKITFVHELGYSKNISVQRLRSQHAFGKNLAKYLAARKDVPDLIYCATPPPRAAESCARYAQQHGVAFIVDIQDLWPQAFSMAFPMPWLHQVLFSRMVHSSRIAYQTADLVLGVSQTYVEAAQTLLNRPLNSAVVFLGTNLPTEIAAKDDSGDAVELVYVGTLSHSYDLPLVFEAMAMVADQDPAFKKLKCLVLGDGPMRAEFEHYAQQCEVNAEFVGRLPYAQMLEALQHSDIALNPIVAGSAGSIINKVGDYAAAGLPVLNTQESPEYRQLLEEYDAGLNCQTGRSADVAQGIRQLVENPERRAQMSRNSRRLAEERFDRNTTYEALAQEILALAHRNHQL